MDINTENTHLIEYPDQLGFLNQAQKNWIKTRIKSRNCVYMPISPKLGNGFILTKVIRSGMFMTIQSLEFFEPVSFSFLPHPHVDLHFALSGGFIIFRNAGDHNGYKLNIRQNRRALYNTTSTDGRTQTIFTYPPNQKHVSLSITFTPDCFEKYIGSLEDSATQNLKLPESFISPLLKGPVSSDMAIIINQIINTSFSGLSWEVFLEAKVLELIAHHINSISVSTADNRLPNALKEYDLDKIRNAKNILLSDIQNPPSLMKLAHSVGLNDFKLKIGFRYLYGDSVFRYLNSYRMEQAKILLMNNEYSVLDIANRVGYSSPSHFTASFKKRFGICPRQYRTYYRFGI